MKIVSMTIECDCGTEYGIYSMPRNCSKCRRALHSTVIEKDDKLAVFVRRNKGRW